MGGGVGLTYGAEYKLVTETTKWAMPEVNIGFFPDVGATYFLNKISAEMARYIVLTARFLQAEDVLYLGYAYQKIAREDFIHLMQDLSSLKTRITQDDLEGILQQYQTSGPKSYLEEHRELIQYYFAADNIPSIMSQLEDGGMQGDIWAQGALREISKGSLLSQYVIMEQLKRGAQLDLEGCFAMEKTLSLNFMYNPDFYEGLRSVLIDKDTADWHYKNKEQISAGLIASFFEEASG